MSEDINKKIAHDFGLLKMDEEEQSRMIEKIGNLLFESVVERAVDVLDEDAMKEFDATLTEEGIDYKKIIGFLKENTPHFDKIVTEEMGRLKRATTGIFA